MQRNRLIASLARATVVTEAGLRSGSLNTAGHTAQLGRPLGAVPGPITSATSSGCHRLIREYGASLITTSEDLQELVGVNGDGAAPSVTSQDNPVHRRVLDSLPLRNPQEITETARRAGLSMDETRSALFELRLLGRVQHHHNPETGGDGWKLV